MKPPFLTLFFAIFLISSMLAKAGIDDSVVVNKQSLIGGFRFQKAVGFYWTNGISLEYNNAKIWNQKISFGLNFVSSKLGSALFSNAIPYYEINFSGIKYFRHEKKLKPLIRLNIGYAHANYGSDIFKDIPNQSMLLSFEIGAAYDFKLPIRIAVTGGYNIITGNGMSGLGVLFPVYAQFSIFYKILI
jgi:hypothetical protein